MATLVQQFYSSTYYNGSIYQSEMSEFDAREADAYTRTGWAGVNLLSVDGLENGNYVTKITCQINHKGRGVKIGLQIGPRGVMDSGAQYPLSYKFFSEGESISAYLNAGPSTPGDGTFYFADGDTAEISSGDREFEPGTVTLLIWNGGSTSRDNMTAIDRGELSGEYDSAVKLTLNNYGASGGQSEVYAYYNEPMPDVSVPTKYAYLTYYPNYDSKSPDVLQYACGFDGYFYNTKQYYGPDGKSVVDVSDLPYDVTLRAQFSLPNVRLAAVRREGYSLDGWYTASEGGTRVGGTADYYQLTKENTNLYAHWKELTYAWSFNPVYAKGNSSDSVVRGLWSGFVGGREVLCAACNGYLWELEQREGGEWGKTACGAIDTSSDVYMFGFDGNMYMLNGSEYKVWDGSTLSDVAGYRPMVAVSVPPAGGGTALEQVNKLCGQRRARLSPDGVEKSFTLPESGLASIDYVRDLKSGEELTNWEPDLASGQVLFFAAPPEGTNSIEVGWSVEEDTAAEIRAMRYAELYNGAQDSRIFVYGDGTNRCFYTGIDYDGQPRADYFPDLNVAHVGDSNTPITAMIRHYNRLLAFKLDSAWSISYNAITLTDGSVTAGFYVTPVNRSIGCCAPGQAVLVENRPRTLDGRSVVEWKSTSSSGNITGDERNAERISQRVDDTIRSFDLTTARTFYDKYAHEYYVIGADGTALVHGIEPDAWYVYTNLRASCLINYKDELYYGTSTGELRHFSDNYFSDEGEAIDAYWESGSMPFDQDFKRKYSAMLWVGIKPEDNGYLAVTAETDRKSDFAEYSFTTGDAAGVPAMNRIKLKAKKFTYYKLKLSNYSADTTATVVSVDIRVRGTGYVR